MLRTLALAMLALKTCWSSHKEEPYRFMVGDKRRFEAYNYQTVEQKLKESYRKNCSAGEEGDNLSWAIVPPDSKLVTSWVSIPAPSTLIDKELCIGNEKFFRKKGCIKGVQLHPDAPRCHRDITQRACEELTAKNIPVVLMDATEARLVTNASLTSTSPFLVYVKNGIVTKCGGVALACGVLQTQTGCGTARDTSADKIRMQCFRGNSTEIARCRSLRKYKAVFVLSYKYDSAIGHFMTEVLPRLVYHMTFLKTRNIVVHYGCDKKYKRFSPPFRFLNWLGFKEENFIQGDVYSEEVIVPRDGACQDALWNFWEIAFTRRYFLEKIGLQKRILWTAAKINEWGGERPVMVVIQRSGSKFSANKGDVTRMWSDETFQVIMTRLAEAFPSISIIPFSERNSTLMKCISCQIELYSRATILLGMHGAGLSNMMFMPSQSIVVEITAHNDGRMLPGSGPFSRLAMATGINHYIHYLKEGSKSFNRKSGVSFDIDGLIDSVVSAVQKFSVNFSQ